MLENWKYSKIASIDLAVLGLLQLHLKSLKRVIFVQHNNVTEKTKQSAFAEGMTNETVIQFQQFLLLIKRESGRIDSYPLTPIQ